MTGTQFAIAILLYSIIVQRVGEMGDSLYIFMVTLSALCHHPISPTPDNRVEKHNAVTEVL